MAQDRDPVGSGFVASLARPGGNITGLSTLSPEISGKQLRAYLEFSQPITGSGPNGGNPVSVPSGLYKVYIISKCNAYGSDWLDSRSMLRAFRPRTRSGCRPTSWEPTCLSRTRSSTRLPARVTAGFGTSRETRRRRED